ncbi:MAG: hypothetical protein H0T92_08035 [Pyrinomonadaceae bacterium]|nr:hypothetical protein [Pyrinomonadaceae bacterium]
MITKEVIKSEIEKVPPERLEERLDELYRVVKSFTMPDPSPEKIFMARLREIKIDGPEDFAANIDLYLTGEKTVG